MRELKTYDKAASIFYEKLSISKIPLISWDFYSHYISKSFEYGNDVRHLNKLSRNWKEQWDFKKELFKDDKVILLTDKTLNIIYASSNMRTLNGYTPDEVKGKSPRLFQGEGTCSKTTNYIRKAVHNKLPFQAKILNYKKDGSTYICNIKGYPIHNRKGELVNFIAFEYAA